MSTIQGSWLGLNLSIYLYMVHFGPSPTVDWGVSEHYFEDKILKWYKNMVTKYYKRLKGFIFMYFRVPLDDWWHNYDFRGSQPRLYFSLFLCTNIWFGNQRSNEIEVIGHTCIHVYTTCFNDGWYSISVYIPPTSHIDECCEFLPY